MPVQSRPINSNPFPMVGLQRPSQAVLSRRIGYCDLPLEIRQLIISFASREVRLKWLLNPHDPHCDWKVIDVVVHNMPRFRLLFPQYYQDCLTMHFTVSLSFPDGNVGLWGWGFHVTSSPDHAMTWKPYKMAGYLVGDSDMVKSFCRKIQHLAIYEHMGSINAINGADTFRRAQDAVRLIVGYSAEESLVNNRQQATVFGTVTAPAHLQVHPNLVSICVAGAYDPIIPVEPYTPILEVDEPDALVPGPPRTLAPNIQLVKQNQGLRADPIIEEYAGWPRINNTRLPSTGRVVHVNAIFTYGKDAQHRDHWSLSMDNVREYYMPFVNSFGVRTPILTWEQLKGKDKRVKVQQSAWAVRKDGRKQKL